MPRKPSDRWMKNATNRQHQPTGVRHGASTMSWPIACTPRAGTDRGVAEEMTGGISEHHQPGRQPHAALQGCLDFEQRPRPIFGLEQATSFPTDCERPGHGTNIRDACAHPAVSSDAGRRHPASSIRSASGGARTGECLLDYGDSGADLYFVAAGKVRVRNPDRLGQGGDLARHRRRRILRRAGGHRWFAALRLDRRRYRCDHREDAAGRIS